MHSVVEIASYERPLLFQARVARCVATPGSDGIMVIVTPFREVVRKLKARRVGRGIFKVNYHKLLVRILRKQERRRGLTCRGWFRYQTQNIAILCLRALVKRQIKGGKKRHTSLWAKTRALVMPPLAR